MTDSQLIEFAKEQIKSGKDFSEVQTMLFTKYGKNISESNKLLDLAKAELGIAEDATDEDKNSVNYFLEGGLLIVAFLLTLFIYWFANSVLSYNLSIVGSFFLLWAAIRTAINFLPRIQKL